MSIKQKNALIIATSFPRKIPDNVTPFMWDYAKGLKNIFKNVSVLVPHSENPTEKSLEIVEKIKIQRFTYFFRNQWQFLCYRDGIPSNLKKYILAWFQIPFFYLFLYFIF